MMAMIDLLPPRCAVGGLRHLAHGDAAAWPRPLLLGGNVRVGLEDNLYLRARRVRQQRGARARTPSAIVESLGARPLTPAEARRKLGPAPPEEADGGAPACAAAAVSPLAPPRSLPASGAAAARAPRAGHPCRRRYTARPAVGRRGRAEEGR